MIVSTVKNLVCAFGVLSVMTVTAHAAATDLVGREYCKVQHFPGKSNASWLRKYTPKNGAKEVVVHGIGQVTKKSEGNTNPHHLDIERLARMMACGLVKEYKGITDIYLHKGIRTALKQDGIPTKLLKGVPGAGYRPDVFVRRVIPNGQIIWSFHERLSGKQTEEELEDHYMKVSAANIKPVIQTAYPKIEFKWGELVPVIKGRP